MQTVPVRTISLGKLWAVLAAVLLLASACGDDGGSTADEGGDSGTTVSAPDSDTPDSDTPEDDTTDDGEPTVGSVDCAEVRDAMEDATDFAGNPTAVSGDDLEADFQKSRDALEAFGEQVPELSADVDTALIGMDALAEAFESIDWDQTSIASDPAKALAFASLIGDPDVAGMATAMQNISAWFAQECAG